MLVIHAPDNPDLAKALASAHAGDTVRSIALAPGDPASLIDALDDVDRIDTVYFLGGLSERPVDPCDVMALADSQQLGVFSLLRLVKALGRRGLTMQPARLIVVVNDVYGVDGSDPANPCAASLVGLTRVIALEYPKLETSIVDVSLSSMAGARCVSDPAWLAGWLGSLRGKNSGRSWPYGASWSIGVCFTRSGCRPPPRRLQGAWRLSRSRWGRRAWDCRWRAISRAGRVLVWCWSAVETWTTGGSRNWRRSKPRVERCSTCAPMPTDPRAMRTVVAAANQRFGPLNGVIHSAIVLEDKTIERMTEEAFRAALDPKVVGSAALWNAVANEPLDFFAFFSSAASFMGSIGQSNYLGRMRIRGHAGTPSRRALGGSYPHLQLGLLGQRRHGFLREPTAGGGARGMGSIEAHEGAIAFEQVIASGLTQVVPIKAEPDLLRRMGVSPGSALEWAPERVPSVLDALGRDVEEYLRGLQFEYPHGAEELEALSRRRVLGVFRRLGVFYRAGERHDGSLKASLGIAADYHRLCDALLEILTRAGYLQVQGDCLTTTSAVEQSQALERDRQEQTGRLLNTHPFMRAFDRLLEACLDGCADVMRAARHPSQVLFPGGYKTLVADTYKTDVYAAYANEIVREVVCRYIEHRSDRPLRMVEVGAGTGATTEVVLRAIAGSASPVRYVYTDVSKSFVQQGAAAFGGRYGFVEFKPLDLEQDPDAQGFERHGADVVIGTNVFHATRDIRHSLQAAKRLLKAGGLLILNETTRLSDFGTMTFGLTSGWWSYQDAESTSPPRRC